VRQVLDRIHEAETALDRELVELYYKPSASKNRRAMSLLWETKRDLWRASLRVLDAAAGPNPPGLDE